MYSERELYRNRDFLGNSGVESFYGRIEAFKHGEGCEHLDYVFEFALNNTVNAVYNEEDARSLGNALVEWADAVKEARKEYESTEEQLPF